MAVYLGLDVGSVSLKAAVILTGKHRPHGEALLASSSFLPATGHEAGDGNTASLLADACLIFSSYRRIQGKPVAALLRLLEELDSHLPLSEVDGVMTTGSGGGLVGEILQVSRVNEFRAVAMGLGNLSPQVRTIFEMGGENSKYLRILPDPREGRVSIIDYEANGDCAAGTGSFMDQQAARLQYAIEDVGDIVSGAAKGANIAGRCSVFAKSDMIHAQQKGCQPPEILKGLSEAVARNFKGNITRGKEVVPPVAFIGGVAYNRGVVAAVRDLFELKPEELLVPEQPVWFAALGAALLAAESPDRFRNDWREVLEARAGRAGGTYPTANPLDMERVTLLRDRAVPASFAGRTLPISAYLGIDVGSVSTNLVVLDEAGNVIKEIYTRTQGRPVEVVSRALKEIEAEVGDRITIRGVGTTGSGRELIGELTGADTINDEITAHKTGAAFIARRMLGSEVDTIFEIGGQDSKFISIRDGVVVDFAMNEACAAGTGSFLEEQAEKLGVRIEGEFARLALSSESPVRLGERCTVFMEQDVTAYQQRGVPTRDIIAGLAYSVVLNYLNRVVRGREIGSSIFFQGGTAYNDAVAAAFTEVLGREVVVPPHNGVVGAIGEALLAQEKMKALAGETTFRGYDLEKVDYRVREFQCKGCSNNCDIQQYTIEGKKTYWGDKCSEKYRKEARTPKTPVIPDLFAKREALLMAGYREPHAGETTVGIPRTMYFFEYFPFFHTYFRELSAGVVISPPTSKPIINAGIEAAVAEPCFPIQLAHGHLKEILRADTDYIFLANIVDAEPLDERINSYLCPWVQTLPFVSRRAPLLEGMAEKTLMPTIHFRLGEGKVTEEMLPVARRLGRGRRDNRRAVAAAYAAQRAFEREVRELGRLALATVEARGEDAVVLLGRPYNIYDLGANLVVPRKLRDQYGVNVIPLDFLSLDDEPVDEVNDSMYWNYGLRILRAANFTRRRPYLHLIYLTNFKCGPDSYIKHFTPELAGKPFLTLQFDGHGNDAGVMTRCEAYLDSKGILRWWKEKKPIPSEVAPSMSPECPTEELEPSLAPSVRSE